MARDIVRPKRPYKSFSEYIAKNSRHNYKLNKDILFYCFMCDGYGRIYDPDEEPCPVEGYKMVGKITCPKCNGSGEGTEAEHRLNFKSIMSKYRNDAKQFDELMKAWKKIRLTEMQRKAIEKFGVPNAAK